MSSGKPIYVDKTKVPIMKLKSLVKSYENIEICGSIRRGVSLIRDIDVVIAPTDTDKLLRELSDASDKGLTTVGTRNVEFTIDKIPVNVLVVNKKDFQSAVLHFTGSKAFNITCRRIAKIRGWKLNEYGLWDGNKRIAWSELGILECLGMGKYKDPRTRCL